MGQTSGRPVYCLPDKTASHQSLRRFPSITVVAPLSRLEVVGHPAAARVSSLGCLALESLKAASEGTWCARRQMALGLSGCAAWLLAGLFTSLTLPPTDSNQPAGPTPVLSACLSFGRPRWICPWIHGLVVCCQAGKEAGDSGRGWCDVIVSMM